MSPSTFFRYFGSKESLLLADDLDPLILDALKAQPRELSLPQAFRRAYATVLSQLPDDQLEFESTRQRLMFSIPELKAAMYDEYYRTVTVAAEAIAHRIGRAADDFEVRVFAGALTGAMMAAFDSAPPRPRPSTGHWISWTPGCRWTERPHQRGDGCVGAERDTLTRCDRDGIDGDSCSSQGQPAWPRRPVRPGCRRVLGTPAAPGGAGPGSVTLTHLFGQTVVKEPPKRVVSAGYTEQDDLLAVGVVPIAVTNWFGDQPFAVWPWAADKLGGAQPTVLNLDNGIPVDQIAGLKPDLIVAINAGLDADTYQKLSAIAPTVAQSDGDAFFEPWKEQAAAVGQAVFAAEKMKSLVAGVDQKFTDIGKKNPQWTGKKALLMHGALWQGTVVATMAGWRTDFLNQMGLVIADSIKPFGTDQRAVIPRDHIKSVLESADVVIWTTQNPDDQKALLGDPEVAGSLTTAQNRHIFTTKDQAGAIAFASPLSYPVIADQLPPQLTKILG